MRMPQLNNVWLADLSVSRVMGQAQIVLNVSRAEFPHHNVTALVALTMIQLLINVYLVIQDVSPVTLRVYRVLSVSHHDNQPLIVIVNQDFTKSL